MRVLDAVVYKMPQSVEYRQVREYEANGIHTLQVHIHKDFYEFQSWVKLEVFSTFSGWKTLITHPCSMYDLSKVTYIGNINDGLEQLITCADAMFEIGKKYVGLGKIGVW